MQEVRRGPEADALSPGGGNEGVQCAEYTGEHGGTGGIVQAQAQSDGQLLQRDMVKEEISCPVAAQKSSQGNHDAAKLIRRRLYGMNAPALQNQLPPAGRVNHAEAKPDGDSPDAQAHTPLRVRGMGQCKAGLQGCDEQKQHKNQPENFLHLLMEVCVGIAPDILENAGR